MSHVELIQVRTADGVRLDGSLAVPGSGATERPLPVDAVLALHGTGSNFYGGGLFEMLAPKLLADGLAVLRANTRGHDVVSTAATLQGPKRLGGAMERVDDCRHDVVAWLEYLVSRGFQSVALVGHSLGAIKAFHSITHTPHPAATRLVAISPPRLSHSYYLKSERADEFLGFFRQAEKLVAAGQGDTLMPVTFPMDFLFSAANYLDKYGADEKFNFLRQMDRLKLPALFIFGGLEIEEVSFRGLPEAVAGAASPTQDVSVVTIEGANHIYTGRIEEVSYKARSWLAAGS